MRITKDVERASEVSFTFDGKVCTAYEGESVACALFISGIRHLRDSPHGGHPRGMFCLMGSCQECVVWLDGRKVLACQQPVAHGMHVCSVTQKDPA